MKNKIEISLNRAMGQMAPDIWDKISSAPENERTESIMNEKIVSFSRKKIIFAVAAAACVLLVTLFGGAFVSTNYIADSLIDIDVNPGIELTTNKLDQVIKASPVNTDGEEILGDMNLSHVNLDVALNAIVGSMVNHGYLKDANSGVLITVRNKNPEKAEALKQIVGQDMDKALSDHKVTANVIEQTVGSDEDLEKLAADNGISLGKAALIQKLSAENDGLDMKKLAGMSMKDITKLMDGKTEPKAPGDNSTKPAVPEKPTVPGTPTTPGNPTAPDKDDTNDKDDANDKDDENDKDDANDKDDTNDDDTNDTDSSVSSGNNDDDTDSSDDKPGDDSNEDADTDSNDDKPGDDSNDDPDTDTSSEDSNDDEEEVSEAESSDVEDVPDADEVPNDEDDAD